MPTPIHWQDPPCPVVMCTAIPGNATELQHPKMFESLTLYNVKISLIDIFHFLFDIHKIRSSSMQGWMEQINNCLSNFPSLNSKDSHEVGTEVSFLFTEPKQANKRPISEISGGAPSEPAKRIKEEPAVKPPEVKQEPEVPPTVMQMLSL